MKQEIFLIDSNIFMTPYKTYYPVDFAPTFWDFLERCMSSGEIVLLDVVYDEVNKGNDDLSKWLSKVAPQRIKRGQGDVLAIYTQILNYIRTGATPSGQPLYNTAALSAWSQNDIADPWLVATAKAKGYTLVSLETPNPSLGTSVTKKVKIPDVAKKFGVKCCNLFEMMRALHFQFK